MLPNNGLVLSNKSTNAITIATFHPVHKNFCNIPLWSYLDEFDNPVLMPEVDVDPVPDMFLSDDIESCEKPLTLELILDMEPLNKQK